MDGSILSGSGCVPQTPSTRVASQNRPGKRVTAVHATRLVSRPRLAADLHATDRWRSQSIRLFGLLVAGIQTCRWLSIGVRSIFAPVFACESCWRCRQADTAAATLRHERVACVDSVAAACARVCCFHGLRHAIFRGFLHYARRRVANARLTTIGVL